MSFKIDNPRAWVQACNERATVDLLVALRQDLRKVIAVNLAAYKEAQAAVALDYDFGLVRKDEKSFWPAYKQHLQERRVSQQILQVLVRADKLAALQLHQLKSTGSHRNAGGLAVHLLSHALRTPKELLMLRAGSWFEPLSPAVHRRTSFKAQSITEVQAVLASSVLQSHPALFGTLPPAAPDTESSASVQDRLYRKVLASTKMTRQERKCLDKLFLRA